MRYASYVLTPNARTVHLLHAHAVTITPTHFTPTYHHSHTFHLGSELGTQQKRPFVMAGIMGINMVSLIAVVIVFVSTKDKGNLLKFLLLYFHTSEVITKMQNTNYQGASAAMGAAASLSGSSDLFIYLFTYLSIYFLHLIRSLH